MQLRYLRVDHLLRALDAGIEEIMGVEKSLSEVVVHVSSDDCRRTLLSGLCVMTQAKLEDVMRELCLLILLAFPEKISQEINLKTKELLNKTDWPSIRGAFIDREIKDLFYKSFSAQVNIFLEYAGIVAPTVIEEVILGLQEFAATRNIVVHSKGEVNQQYLDLAGKKARMKRADGKIPINDAYLKRSCGLMRDLLLWLKQELGNKYAQYTKSRLIKEAWNECFSSTILKFEDWWRVDANNEIQCFEYDNKWWDNASTGEKVFLAYFSQMYTGHCKNSSDYRFEHLDTENIKRMSELITMKDYLFR